MEEIKGIVYKVIGDIDSKKPQGYSKLQRIWEGFLKGQGAEHTKIMEISDGNLTVHVDSSVWLFQLKMKKRIILEQLQEETLEVKDIFFRIGKIH